MYLNTDVGDTIFGRTLLATSRRGGESNFLPKSERQFERNERKFWLEDRGGGAICTIDKEFTVNIENIKKILKGNKSLVEHKKNLGLKGEKLKGECKDFNKGRRPVPRTARHKAQNFEIKGEPTFCFIDKSLKSYSKIIII